MEGIRCRICDSALIVVGPFDGPGDGEGLPGNSKVRLESDGGGHFFTCPYCAARNMTVMTTAQNGRPAVQVAWAVMHVE